MKKEYAKHDEEFKKIYDKYKVLHFIIRLTL